MIARESTDTPPLKRSEALKLLADTAQAVRVMKASWLRVALNLRRIRAEELWRLTTPPCASFEDYAFGVLKLNRAVARRMLQAIDYTEERRPHLIDDYIRRGDEVEVPSYDVIHQLRRVEESFRDREDDFEALESMVFDEGVGRVALKREIDSRIGAMATGGPSETGAADSLAAVLEDLKAIEKRLLALKPSKELRKQVFDLVEALEKEASGRKGAKAGDDGR
jgi:hypothetical protein